MPDAAVAEPATEITPEISPTPTGGEEEITVSEPGFGNLKEAFDEAFPSTAKKEDSPAPQPAAPQGGNTDDGAKAPAATPEKATPDKFADIVPDAVFGEKTEEKPAAAAASPTTEPRIEVPAHIKDPKQIKNFEQMRDLYEGTKRELARVASESARQLAEARKAPELEPLQKQIEQLNQEKRDLLAIVERKSVEDHPKFKEQITAPREQAMAEGRQLLADANVDPKQLDRAMSKTGPERIDALEEIYEKLPEAAKAELAAAVLTVKRLDTRRSEILKNAKTEAEKLFRQDKLDEHQSYQQREQQMVQLLDAAANYLTQEQGYEAFRKLEGDDAATRKWNEGVEQRLADAKELLTREPDVRKHAVSAYLATACPFYRDLALTYRKQLQGARKEIAEIKGAEPRLQGDGDGGAPESDEDDKLTFAERVARKSGLR